MSSLEPGASSASTTHTPLFASSWMALYTLIRDGLDGGREAGNDASLDDVPQDLAETSES
ncbi:hypothetical protein F3N42_04890 [Marinihelvus fidelis]|uniref:Uncharacterized protein n=1 Tax=Marinihelvus fidelis TaxID=2613842 RepID=A0A5N0TC74_9GAMM|nr:hypothetical protein [Marinihelvus fidelis]KAA9132560.1 hypothetical protein F3N42_04890 [Marinihelvus fidelis]